MGKECWQGFQGIVDHCCFARTQRPKVLSDFLAMGHPAEVSHKLDLWSPIGTVAKPSNF